MIDKSIMFITLLIKSESLVFKILDKNLYLSFADRNITIKSAVKCLLY